MPDAVIEEVKAWQSRPLDALYPIVYLDCIHVKVRDTGTVRAKAVYLALGINMAGEGIWIAQTEGAKFPSTVNLLLEVPVMQTFPNIGGACSLPQCGCVRCIRRFRSQSE